MLHEPTAARRTLGAEIIAADAACRAALAMAAGNVLEAVPTLPGSAEGCFAVLKRIGFSTRTDPQLARWTEAARAREIAAPHAVERYLALQAATVALARLDGLPADEDIKRQLCATIALVASSGGDADPRLSYRHDAFAELARLVTLRRLHAGQFSFDVSRISLGCLAGWALSMHPRDLPGWSRELAGRAGVFGPALFPHLCYWRPGGGHIVAAEQTRSLLRAAKTLVFYPDVRALVGVSWLLSPEVGANFPHLAFVRNIFVENGAYAVGLGPARPTDGYLTGSERRRSLYAEGKFCPEITCVIWRREELLSWAEACEAGTRGDTSPLHENNRHAGTTHTRRTVCNAGPRTWTRARKLLYQRPKLYAGAAILAPAALGAILAARVFGWPLAIPGFLMTATLMWLFQSFVLLR